MEDREAGQGNAILRLWGHGRVRVHLEVERYPTWAWCLRVILRIVAWVVVTTLTLIMTFDPFIASFPCVIGIAVIYRSVRGRYLVRSFRGSCPACAKELVIATGAKIDLPHVLTCFGCHFEPELLVVQPFACCKQ
jgi:hypothetical protein